MTTAARSAIILKLAVGFCVVACGQAVPSGPHNDRTVVVRDIHYKLAVQQTTPDRSTGEFARCRLDLYIPELAKSRSATNRLPVLVWFHGGGLTSGHKNSEEAKVVGTQLSGRNILVVMVDYRLSPDTTYPGYVEDAAASVAWTIKNIGNYGGNPERIVVAGHSAGAYLTLLVGLDDGYLAKYGYKISQLAGTIPVSGQVDSHWTVRAERGIARDTQVIDESAPMHHVRPDAPPMLLILAENDLEGRDEMNRLFLNKMKAAGHRQIYYHKIANRNHVSLINRMNQAEDPVSDLIANFVLHRAKPKR